MSVLEAHRTVFKQQRIYRRVLARVLAEIMVFGRHTVTQLLVALGLNEQDWSSWYRVFHQRFQAEAAESLRHVGVDEVYVVVGDGTQTPRWSLNTLWRAYRAALWGQHAFRPLWMASPDDWTKKDTLLQGLRNAVYGATRS